MSLRSLWSRAFGALSPGIWVIVVIAVAVSLVRIFWPVPIREGRDVWLFALPHQISYEPVIEAWNEANPEHRLQTRVLHHRALERRVLSGFLSGTPVADLIEVERQTAARALSGPEPSIGFVDLTERLERDGLMNDIEAAAFSPWTVRGRIYGLPRGIHPCVLAYRADIVEAAGIDVSGIETWDDFYQVLSPLIADLDGDGRIDRYLLNFWPSPSSRNMIEALILQAGGATFDHERGLTIDSEINARTLATMATWVAGPRRMGVDAPEWTATGNQMRLEGTVLASVMPDWLAGNWRNSNPGLAGKVKVMPVPAWTRGGRRTTVLGGSMMGIAKAAPNIEAAWEAAKQLYLSPAAAESLWERVSLISPVRAHWTRPIYHRPDPYFSGQKIGELFIRLAPDVPTRNSSAYAVFSMQRMVDVLLLLQMYANQEDHYTVGELLPEARRLLKGLHAQMAAEISRNAFEQWDNEGS